MAIEITFFLKLVWLHHNQYLLLLNAEHKRNCTGHQTYACEEGHKIPQECDGKERSGSLP